MPDASEPLTRDAVRVLELVGLPVPQENRLQHLARRTMRPSAYIDIDEDGAGLRRDPVELGELRATMRTHAREHASPQPT